MKDYDWNEYYLAKHYSKIYFIFQSISSSLVVIKYHINDEEFLLGTHLIIDIIEK
jgi:hypothetical protein